MTVSTNPIRVLHVDDDPDIADMVATFLERESERISVQTASSAAEGLETIAEAEPDCVVSDYEMPGTNGIEFLEAVRESNSDLPFILYTGKGSEEVAADAISAGVTDYLQKETGTDQYAILTNRIKNAVSAHRSSIEAEQNRQHLERTLRAVPSCVVRLDCDGRFVFANDRAVEVLGLEESELTDRGYNDPEWEITDLDGNPIPDEELPFRQVVDSGEPVYGFRHTIKWPDGTEKALLVNGEPLVDTDGEITGVIFSLTDITEQREHEQRLKQAMARLEALFEDSPDMINLHNMDGDIIDPNPLLCEELGYDEDELTEMKVWELDTGIDADAARTLWAEMDPGDRERLEGAFQRRDGSELPVEIHIRRLDLEGKNRFMVISRDITARKQKEEQLQQERDRFQGVFEEAFDAMVLADDDGKNIALNKSAIALFGLSEAELLDRSIDELVPPEFDFEGVWSNMEQSETKRGTFPIVRPDGDRRIIEYAATQDVVPGQHLLVLRDLTDREQREQRLNQQNERLEEFASIVSHDLRNPLNVAAGSVELASEDCNSAQLERAESALERMDALIADLLTLARDGETVSDLQPVALRSVVESCWANVATMDATVTIDTEQVILADESRLKQLVENLISNAVEHGGEDITVTVGDLDNGFYVADTGSGIPADRRETIFEAGYSTDEDGTGFGLSIVKEVVSAHGWEITVTAGADGGAVFEINGIDVRAD